MKSLYSSKYRLFLAILVEARKRSGMTQQELANKLKRPQSFVSKVENGERRIDVVEFLAIAGLIGADPYAVIDKIEQTRGKR